ncbi:hypothetical protein HQ576_00810 [bacterium]|nr:hypothetical protein [bacterium]
MAHHPGRRQRFLPVSVAGVVVIAAVLLLSCTPDEKHRLLTFFFDGVPPLHPVAKAAAKGKGPKGKSKPAEHPSRPREVWSEHAPSRDKRSCGQCHDRKASFALLRPASELCLPCHQKETRQYPRMHGPVAVGQCNLCHDAHRAPRKHLVRAAVQGLCFQCHERTTEGEPTRGCTRASDKAACTTCHNPHGGTQPYYLVRRGTPPKSPTTTGPSTAKEGRQP